jgi:hypothetical protein
MLGLWLSVADTTYVVNFQANVSTVFQSIVQSIPVWAWLVWTFSAVLTLFPLLWSITYLLVLGLQCGHPALVQQS